MAKKTRIGVVGTGFIGNGLAHVLSDQPDVELSRVLTRRKPEEAQELFRPELATRDVQELIDHSDLIVECSGDVLHATDVVAAAFEAELPVVTMNSEFQVTTGSFFAGRGYLTEAEGDQPGSLAALRENVLSMGFTRWSTGI